MTRLRTGRGGRGLVEVAAAAALVAGGGCLSPSPTGTGLPVTLPAAVAIVTASAAPPLRFGHPTPEELAAASAETKPEAALALRVRFVALPGPPDGLVARPLDEDAHAIVDPRQGDLELASVLATGARTLVGVTADQLLARPRASLAGDILVALPRGTTVEVALRSERPAPPTPLGPGGDVEPAPRAREQVSLLVRRRRPSPVASGAAALVSSPETVEVAIDLESMAPPPPPDEPGAADRTPGATRGDQPRIRALVHDARAGGAGSRELVALAPRPLALPSQLAWVVPAPFSSESGRRTAWVAITVDLDEPPHPGQTGAAAHRRALEATLASLGAERERLDRERPLPAPPLHARVVDRTPVPLAPVFDTLARDPQPRAGLVTIGTRMGAGLLTDAALALPDPLLPRLARDVLAARARHAGLRVAAAACGGAPAAVLARARPLALALDLAALDVLLAPEARDFTRVVLERRFGVAVEDDPVDPRHPFLRRAGSLEDVAALERLVLARNLIALDDSRPSVRFRAARWLRASHGEFLGYDPFGPLEERRAAIDRLWNVLYVRRTGS